MTNRTKGVCFILLSSLGFSMMNVLIPLAGDLPSIQKSFFRNMIAMIVAGGLLIKEIRQKGAIKEFEQWKQTPWGLLVVRALCGTIGIWCNFYAVDRLILSDATVLGKISPFMTLIFSYWFLKERLTKFHIVAIALAFTGVLFVVKPSLASPHLVAYIIGILGGVFAGAAYTTVRKLNQLQVTPAFIIFFFSTFSCIISLPQLLLNYEPMTLSTVLILIGVGVMATVGQFGITFAYKFAPASEISIFDYSMIVFSGILGYIILDQVPDVWSMIGYIIIVVAGGMTFYYNRWLLRKEI